MKSGPLFLSAFSLAVEFAQARPSPNLPPVQPSGQKEVATFENAGFLPIVAAAPVGRYLDIFYNGMSGGSALTQPVAGIKPQSPPNDVAYSTLDDATILQGQPAMTTVYQGSNFKFFDLISFYFGCVIAAETSEDAVPLGCSVSVECISTAGKQIAKQSFDFKANGSLVQDMVQAKPKEFKSCQKVNFNTTFDPSLLHLVGATGLDTFEYVIYKK